MFQSDLDWHNPHSGSALQRAVRNRNMEDVQRELERGANPDIYDNHGRTALHEASFSDSCNQVLKLLLSSGAYINHLTHENLTALMIAASKGCEKNVRTLLKHGCKVNFRCNMGRTALHYAAEQDNENIIKHLVKRGAKVNIRDVKGRTPLLAAIEKNKEDNVKLLTMLGADIRCSDEYNRNVIHYACSYCDIEMFNLLITCTDDISIIFHKSDGLWSTLMDAIQSKRHAIVRKLLLFGAKVDEVDERGFLPIHIAAHCGMNEIFKMVLDNTPYDILVRYCKYNPDSTDFFTSLPCLLIDANMYGGLMYLYNRSDMKNEHLIVNAPTVVREFVQSPAYYTMAHHSLKFDDRVAFLKQMIEYKLELEPSYMNPHNENHGSIVEAAVSLHEEEHENCLCLLLLQMALQQGATPDFHNQDGVPTVYEIASATNRVEIFSSLFSYSQVIEPEEYLHSLFQARPRFHCLPEPGKNKEFIDFLISHCCYLPSSIIPLHCERQQYWLRYVFQNSKFPTLFMLAKREVRSFFRSVYGPNMFQKIIRDLNIPKTVIERLLVFEYTLSEKPCFRTWFA